MEATKTERQLYGVEVERDQWKPELDVICPPEQSPSGNIILRTGTENGPEAEGWHQTGHVVLKPREAADLCRRILLLAKQAVSEESDE